MKSLKDFEEFRVEKTEVLRGGYKVTETKLNGTTQDTTTQLDNGDCVLTAGIDAYACDSNCNHCQ